jgi:uracil-DNA glycosylase
LEPPSRLAQRWVDCGVLLLNASLTLSRFRIDVDPHQARGHLPLWRPWMIAVLRMLFDRGSPLVVIAFGDAAADTLRRAGVVEGQHAGCAVILRDHPARADAVLARDNPFVLCNAFLETMGVKPIVW